MRVFRVRHDSSRYAYLLPKLQRDSLIFDQLGGSTIASTWTPPQLILKKGSRQRVGNFFHFAGGCIICDRDVVDEIGSLVLRPAGELLPLKYGKNEYYLLNVTRVVDCIDYGQTEYERGSLQDAVNAKERRDALFSQSLRLGRIIQFAFLTTELPQSGLFKVPQVSWTHLFYSDNKTSGPCSLLDTLEKHGLEGLVFEPHWHD